ncbi:MAG: VCBS repeat-containing protein [Candidatus Zixiibacteriota bacterium]|nr:MAG: VCBS repeat-containing protein [candidate division Zixibacteria bacterium]
MYSGKKTMLKWLLLSITILAFTDNPVYAQLPWFHHLADYSVGDMPVSMVSTDLDNDGDNDLAVACILTNKIFLFDNRGDATFDTAGSVNIGMFSSPTYILSANFDGDSDNDLAVVKGTAGKIIILRNDGDFDFQPAGEYPVNSAVPMGACTEDFDGDLDYDLIVANTGTDSISYLENNGDGSFNPMVNLGVGGPPYCVLAADFNNDENADVAVTDGNGVVILLGDGDGSFSPDEFYNAAGASAGLVADDFDGDDYIDLAVANSDLDLVSVLFNLGDGSFASPFNYAVRVFDGVNALAAADFDHDTHVDLAVANYNLDSISILRNNGFGVFSLQHTTHVGSLPNALCAADFDNDTDIDLAVGNFSDGNISILSSTAVTVCVDTDGDSYGDPGHPENDCLDDNCPETYNPDQIDSDGDGSGDACDNDLSLTSLDDSGVGTLRWIIEAANTLPGPDTIAFDISGTILLTSALPELTDDSTFILGSTAPSGEHSVIVNGSGPGKFAGNGLLISGSYTFVEGLTITGFEDNGIQVIGATARYNTFSNNLIYSNGGLGINLGVDGVTDNDPDDLDDGPNDLLNFPEIDSVHMNPDSSFIVYGRAADSAVIEFFVAHPAGDDNKPADAISGHGPAYSFVGADTADNNGDFTYDISNDYRYFSFVTATATDTLGNTSEFSANFALVPSPLVIMAFCPVNLQVFDPQGDSIGMTPQDDLFQSIFPASYTDSDSFDSVHIANPLLGDYTIIVVPDDDAPPGETFSVGIRLDGSLQCIIVDEGEVPVSGQADTTVYLVEEDYHYLNGDANRDESVNLLDILFLIDYLYGSPLGPAPDPPGAGDANCDLDINLLDILYLIDHLYGSPPGPAPCELDE